MENEQPLKDPKPPKQAKRAAATVHRRFNAVDTTFHTAGFASMQFQDRTSADIRVVASSVIDSEAYGQQAYDTPGFSAVILGRLQRPELKVLNREAGVVGLPSTCPQLTGWRDYPLPPQVHIFHLIHLSREQAKGLADALNHWLKDGSFGV